MPQYLIIDSRGPFEGASAARTYALASELAMAGNQVTLFLIENGVLGARRSQASEALSSVADRGVTVLADAFSLRERGVELSRLARGIERASIDAIVDRLERGAISLWH